MRFRLFSLILATALPLVIFAAAMVVLFEKEQARSFAGVIEQATGAAQRAVEARIDTIRIALEALTTSDPLAAGDQEAFAGQAQRLLALQPDWMALELAGPDGPTRIAREDYRLPDEGAVDTQTVFTYGEPQVSGILVDPERRSEPVVAVSVPLLGSQGVERVLTAYVRAWTVNRALRDQGVIPGWQIVVIDADGRLVARTLSDDPMDPALGARPDPSVAEGLGRNENFFFAHALTGEDVYTAVASSATTGWTVLVAAPAALIQKPLWRNMAAVIGGGLLALTLAVTFGWSLTRAYRRQQAAEQRALQLEAARAAEQRTVAILESTTDCVYEVDRTWCITFINHRARDLIAGGQDVTGRSLWNVFLEAEATAFWEQLHKVAAERTPVEFEAFYAPLRAWYAVRAFPSEEGGVAVYFQDVTERRQAREALAESERRYRFMAESIPQIVWTAEPDGNVDYLNSRWTDYIGADGAEAGTGWSWSAFVHPDDVPEALAEWEEARAAGRALDVEFRLRRRDGSYRWHLARALPLHDTKGRIVKWFGSMTDIHDQKLYEETLRAARDDAEHAKAEAEEARAEAERANLAKSKFLAAASHDLRQPMQSLFLFAESLERYIVDQRGRERLLHLRRGLDALKGLLDSLLDVSRLDAGLIEPVIEDFPIRQVLDQVGDAYAQVAAAKGLAFEIEPCDAYVRSDPTLLGRMLRNLLENAVRYTERGRIKVVCTRAGEHLRVEVHDTGIGISAEHLRHIWEEFYQVGNPERDRNQGLGLGLAIVQRLSTLLGHKVDVRSVKGEGSVFSLEVPLGKAAGAVPKPPAAGPGQGAGRLAVLVDDDAIVLLGLETMLEDWGYEVLAAGSTEQALANLEAKGQRPDVVLADYRLREHRVGTEAIVKIRERFGAKIPGILVTGETGPECARDAMRHDIAIAYKPVTPDQLGNVLERLLAGRHGLEGAANLDLRS
ncbi:ATP-binding protein [Benzoatithermus flavus]|uniref:histidine kinase n=1 Tax=Benzoatithermus flavus TaxID=3108223 RepID=A0ABU8XS92_9PROT